MSILRRAPLLAATLGVFALAACVDTTNPDPDRNRTRDGAVIGGLLGGLYGLSRGDDGRDRFIKGAVGAGVGAAIGGVIGQQLDKQARELQAAMDDDVTVVNTGSELVVTMPQDILFDVDSTYVQAGLRDDLQVLARSLNDYPDTTVDVIGHTDNTGSAAYNQDLSARRAAAVADVLIGAGVRPARVRAYGRGEDQPVASNLTAEGRALNRRVEIVIRPQA